MTFQDVRRFEFTGYFDQKVGKQPFCACSEAQYVRLEAATSRLEDLTEVRGFEVPEHVRESQAAQLSGYEGTPTSTTPVVTEEPKTITAFDEDVVDGKLRPFVELTRSFCANPLIEQVSSIDA